VTATLDAEIAEGKQSVGEYRRVGQTDRAEVLRQELEILRGYVSHR
jgi:uncharacterized protein YqeY